MSFPLNDEQTGALLDAGVNELLSVDDVIEQLCEVPSNVLLSYMNHRFYAQCLFPRLTQILEEWNKGQTTLSDKNSVTLRHTSNFILRMCNSMSNELQNNKVLLTMMQKCLNSVSSCGYFVRTFNKEEDSNLGSFDCLVQAYTEIKCKTLLKHVARCAASSLCATALMPMDFCSLSITQHFLLMTCSDYVLRFDKPNGKYVCSILNQNSFGYSNILNENIRNVNNWTKYHFIYSSLFLRIIASGIRSLDPNIMQWFVDIAAKILGHDTITFNLNSRETEILWTSIIHSALRILLEISRCTLQLLNQIRDEEKFFQKILDMLQDLSKNDQDENIRLQSLELISIIVPDEQFSQMFDMDKVVEFFLKKLNEAIEDETTTEEDYNHKVEELLLGIKTLVQNNDIREYFVKQGGICPLIKHTEKSLNNALSLEIIYALVLTITGMDELKKDQYKDFVDRVKQMRQSDNERVRQAAGGIIWKLEEEDNFGEIIKERKRNTPLVAMPVFNFATNVSARCAQMPAQDNYHIMISYCWESKLLCRKIYERLQNDKYRVWIDENEMYGSIIERMAEAIENSEIILMCMSSGYKKSLNCQVEAEYAYKRNKTIVPLVLGSKYKPDGWLGLIAGNKLYIHFADRTDEEFEETYNTLIIQLKRNGLKLTELTDMGTETTFPDIDKNESKLQLEIEQNLESERTKKEEIIVAELSTKEYRRIAKITDWNEHHVAQFFIDNNLNSLLSILKGIDGQGLIELHRVYERSPKNLYQMFNKDGETVSLGLFFKFIGAFKKYNTMTEQMVYF